MQGSCTHELIAGVVIRYAQGKDSENPAGIKDNS